ncbi:MAG: sugar transferase [Phycisphaerae bacterium]|nr:sugar transferase [Phycisphaerae bacterium]
MAKRIFDIVVSAILLMFTAPWILLLAVWIRLDSPGDPVFRQRRVGWRGRPFAMLKFRTMRTDVNPYGMSPRSADDPRLTRLGRRLRETSLDEWPQLWNVLTGSMSLVGPRPLYERQAEKWTPHQRRRLEVKPGLTGYAQVMGRGALTHEEKIELDLVYVERHNLALDVKLLWMTLWGGSAGQRDVYEQRYSVDRRREMESNGAEDGRRQADEGTRVY